MPKGEYARQSRGKYNKPLLSPKEEQLYYNLTQYSHAVKDIANEMGWEKGTMHSFSHRLYEKLGITGPNKRLQLVQIQRNRVKNEGS